MDRVGSRVKVKFLRVIQSENTQANATATDNNTTTKPQWLKATVQAFRPSSGKHLVVFDVVYGRCVRGGLFWQHEESQTQFPERSKDDYKQTYLDRKCLLIVPCKRLQKGIACQRWAMSLYYDRCDCARLLTLMCRRRPEKLPSAVEDPDDPITQCLNWGVWIDLNSLLLVGQVKQIEQLPIVCVCRKVLLPEKDGGYAGDQYRVCQGCKENFHTDCIKGLETIDEATWNCPFCQVKAELQTKTTALKPDDATAVAAGNGFDEKLATSHRVAGLPSTLCEARKWRFWYNPAGGPSLSTVEKQNSGQGEWIYCLNTLQHMCGTRAEAFMDVELDLLMGYTERHREDVLPILVVDPSEKDKQRRAYFITDDGLDDGFNLCASAGVEKMVKENDFATRSLPQLETFMRGFGRSEENDGFSVKPWLLLEPSGKSIVHTPRGGFLEERDEHTEVDFSSSAYFTKVNKTFRLSDDPGFISLDGCRHMLKWPGSKGTTTETCARVRPRSDNDHRVSSRQHKVGPFLQATLPVNRENLILYEEVRKRKTLPGEEEAVTASSTAKKRQHGLGQRRQLRGVAASIEDISAKNLSLGRETRLRFGKSGIHAWGVYAEQDFQANEFVIEYKGELIRPVLSDLRQKWYEDQGIQDYMFGIDSETICDATQKGSLARFINHSCDPNCTTKIIEHQGVKKIVIYTKRAVSIGEELSYDYKFPLETDPAEKIPCFCGSENCRRYMN